MFFLNRFHFSSRSRVFSLNHIRHKKLRHSQASIGTRVLHDMPVLSDFMSILQKEFGSNFSKLPNRHSTLFIMVQHGFVTITPLMESILALGIDSKQIISTTKPHTTSSEMLNYFHKRFGTNYLQFQWPRMQEEMQEQRTKDDKTPYQRASEATYEMLLVKVCNYLFYSASPEIKNIIVCDEGGKFLKVFMHRYFNPDDKYSKKLSDYRVVAIEHTKCGIHSEALGRLSFPMINMADSFLKTQIESKFIAKAMITSLKNIFSTISDSMSSTIGVIGGGNIGKEVLRTLQQEYPTASLILYDQESGVLHNAKLKEKGFARVTRVESAETAYKKAGIILGCTGKDITHKSIFTLDWLKKNLHAQVHFISCSSGDREFYSLLQQIPGYQLKSVEDIHDWHIPLFSDTQQTLIIHNGGFPINFLANKGVPAHEIQLTRSMKLAAIVQALKLLEIMIYQPNQEKYIQLDEDYQHQIIQSFYKHQLERLGHEEATTGIRQEKIRENYVNEYQSITIDQIVQGSVGVKQPTLQHVINLPFYVKTIYQAQLEKMLAAQREPIKRIAICGPAGSGKTFLAEYVLKTNQVVRPADLTRKLLAETRDQWRFSLREWAETLSSGLSAALEAMSDPEKQNRRITQVIQDVLRITPWCLLVDNWEVNTGPSIHEITQLEVGQGILLLTTQAQSPFDRVESLDLSRGFIQEESEALLCQTMNLAEELRMEKDFLGDDMQRMQLLTTINHLPLAIVQAGTYLLLENKKRQKFSRPVFTYVDYQTLLLGETDALIKQHETLYKNKADAPQKIQEAVIKISLTKLIDFCIQEKKVFNLFLLYFCSFISSDNIPQLLMKDFIRTIYSEASEEEIQMHFESFIDDLQSYSFFQFEDNISIADNLASLRLHRVTQRVLRNNDQLIFENFKNRNFNEEFREALFVMMSSTFSSRVSESNIQMNIKKAYIPHLMTMISELVRSGYKSKKIDEILLFQLKNLAWAIFQFGEYREAERLFRACLAGQITADFSGDKQCLAVALAQHSLAYTLERLGKYTEAMELIEKVLKTAEKLSDERLVFLAESLLAPLLLRAGNYETAEKLNRKLLNNAVADDIASVKKNLGTALLHLGKYEEAVFYLKQALEETKQQTKTDQHMLVAAIKHDLGVGLKGLGEFEESEKFLLEALETTRAHYTQKHNLAIALIQVDLASTYINLHRDQEAIVLSQAALETMKAHYDEKDNIVIATVHQNLGISWYKLLDFDRSEEAFKQALSIQLKHYGTPDHLDVANTRICLAMLYQTLKKYKKALSYIIQCEKIFSTHPGGGQHLPRCLKIKKEIQEKLSQKSHTTSREFASDVETSDHENIQVNYNKLFSDYIGHNRSLLIRCAAGNGKVNNLSYLLAQHPEELDVTDNNPRRGWTALHWAVRHSHLDTVRYLLDFGARYNIPDCTSEKLTAVDICLENSNTEIKLLFIKHIIEHYEYDGLYSAEHALRMAAHSGSLSEVKLLISDKININDADSKTGRTALHYAVINKHAAIALALLEAGASCNISDSSGKTATDYIRNDEQLAAIFSQNADVEATTNPTICL